MPNIVKTISKFIISKAITIKNKIGVLVVDLKDPINLLAKS